MRVSQGLTAGGSDLVLSVPRFCAAVGAAGMHVAADGLQAGRRARRRRLKTAAAEASRKAAGGSAPDGAQKIHLSRRYRRFQKYRPKKRASANRMR